MEIAPVPNFPLVHHALIYYRTVIVSAVHPFRAVILFARDNKVPISRIPHIDNPGLPFRKVLRIVDVKILRFMKCSVAFGIFMVHLQLSNASKCITITQIDKHRTFFVSFVCSFLFGVISGPSELVLFPFRKYPHLVNPRIESPIAVLYASTGIFMSCGSSFHSYVQIQNTRSMKKFDIIVLGALNSKEELCKPHPHQLGPRQNMNTIS